MSFLSVKGLSKKEGGKTVVDNVHFTLQPTEKLAIAGETGSGKTSLLKMIGGHLQPDSGNTFFKGERVLGPLEKLLPGHPRIAFLSQHFELRNNFFVHEILEYANELPPEKSTLLYTICRIDHLLSRRTDQLSGGERQRIALAKLLSTSPELLLLDEPFSNLDAIHKSVIKSVIRDIGEQLNITCILVAHEGPDVLSWADKIIVMRNGVVVQEGTPVEIYNEPANEYVAGLFGEYNLIPATGENGESIARIVRPESISVNREGSGVEATVQKTTFWGSYYSVDAWIGNNLVRARVSSDEFKEGERVFLEFDR